MYFILFSHELFFCFHTILSCVGLPGKPGFFQCADAFGKIWRADVRFINSLPSDMWSVPRARREAGLLSLLLLLLLLVLGGVFDVAAKFIVFSCEPEPVDSSRRSRSRAL